MNIIALFSVFNLCLAWLIFAILKWFFQKLNSNNLWLLLGGIGLWGIITLAFDHGAAIYGGYFAEQLEIMKNADSMLVPFIVIELITVLLAALGLLKLVRMKSWYQAASFLMVCFYLIMKFLVFGLASTASSTTVIPGGDSSTFYVGDLIGVGVGLVLLLFVNWLLARK